MLFIKYVSDKYADSNDIEPMVRTTKCFSFRDIVALKGKPDLGDKINTQIIQPLIDSNGKSPKRDLPHLKDPNKLGEGQEVADQLGGLMAAILNLHLPSWRELRLVLNELPLGV